jgi:hypothetical protein
MEPSRRAFLALLAALAAGLMLLPAVAQAESLHVVFPQSAEVTVVQGSSTDFSIEVQAFGATQCDATTARLRVDRLYSVDAAGNVAASDPADMPITTDQQLGDSENCNIKSPVVVPLRATAAAGTPVGDYTSIIRWGKGGDGDVDEIGPTLTVHVVPPPKAPVVVQPVLPPPVIIVLGERESPKPKLGKSVMLTLVSGTVRYVAPGQALQTLTDAVIVPNGTKVDATDGVVKVTVARDGSGALDSVAAWDGAFTVAQAVEKGGRGLTTFTLRDAFNVPASKGAIAASTAFAAKKKHHSLWVNGKGNFKTRGKRASAIIRGTQWLTEETDAGTKVSVQRGEVAVRDFANHKTVVVKSGQSYTAKPRKVVHHRAPAFTG